MFQPRAGRCLHLPSPTQVQLTRSRFESMPSSRASTASHTPVPGRDGNASFWTDGGALFALVSWLAAAAFIVTEEHEDRPVMKHDTAGPPAWRPTTDDAPLIIGGFVAIFSLFHLIAKKLFYEETTSFFLEHTVVNAIVVALVWRDLILTLQEPLHSMTRQYSLWPTYIQIAFHVAHIVMEFRTLTMMDWIHHLLSSVFVGIANIYYTYGPLLNYAIFFATGFPGGIDYFLLYLVKRKIIPTMAEKRINRLLNIILRSPGLVAWMAFGHVTFSHHVSANHWRTTDGTLDMSQREMPIASLVFMYFFIAGNGIFFADRVVGNYHVKRYEHHHGLRNKTA
jgi:hypothetical protein